MKDMEITGDFKTQPTTNNQQQPTYYNIIMKLNTKTTLAASVLAGGMLFSGGADAANVVADTSFEGVDGTNQTTAWGTYKPYAQTYGGVSGPDLNLVNTVDYGYFDNISMSAGNTYMGIEQEASKILSQTVSLENADVSLGQITLGLGRFAFSGWLQTCCNDEHGLYLTFNDAASTQIIFDLTTTTNQITTADKEVNPGGSNNTTSETDKKYWKFYEVKGVIPTDATSALIEIKLAPGQNGSGAYDFGTDLVILDTVAVPEPSSAALLGLGGLALILRRRK